MNQTIYVKRFDTAAVCDVSEDFVLPDYIPEVRRVIGVRAAVSADGKYLSGDELETDGGVTYDVLYVGGDGAIAMTSQTSSYTGRVPLKAEDDRFTPQDIVLSCAAENVSCRVTAPRRITLSSKVRLRVLSQKPADVTMKTEGPYAVRRKTEERRCAALSEHRQTGECSGEIREREGMQLLLASGELCLSDARINGGVVKVNGDAYVTAVLLSPEGAYVTAKSRVPVEEEIPLPEGAGEGSCHAAAFGEVVLLEMQAADDGVLTWRMEYDVDCDVLRCTAASVTVDAYLTGSADTLEAASYDAVYPAAAVNGRLTTQGSAKLKPGMAYVCAWGRGSADKLETANGRLVISGNVYVSAVEAGGGEAVLDEFAIPFRYECEAVSDKAADNASLSGKTSVRVTDIQARCDGDVLNVTAELAISAAVIGMETVKCAASISPAPDDAPFRKSDTMIRIYVPDDGETAWDVEKKFRLGRDAKAEGSVYVI
ncbi:MAG: hypothetical protein ACI4V1_08340 [Eubacteriales bacterium]